VDHFARLLRARRRRALRARAIQLLRLACVSVPAANEWKRFCTAMFHVLDAISVFITLLLVAAVEDGVRAAAEMVLLAPLLSPGGAAALYLAKRERRIAGLADEEERTKAA
jgi:hypothetical protein